MAATRAESVAAALAEVPDEALVVLVHDAARPLVDDTLVERLLGPLGEGFDGAVPVLPVADTLKRVRDGVVVETVAREGLVAAQTPQAFLAPTLRRAFSQELAGRYGLCVARRAGRREGRGRGRRSATPQGHDARRSRARRVVALKAVVFDVGETLVDEERWWRRLADRDGLQPHVVWAALGVTIERGEEHSELWRHLGIDAASSLVERDPLLARRPVSGRARLPSASR